MLLERIEDPRWVAIAHSANVAIIDGERVDEAIHALVEQRLHEDE